MTEFKVGDKVKIVENKSASDNKVGEIGVITYVSEASCFVEVAKDRLGCYHVFSDLELVSAEEKPKFYEEIVTRKVVLNRNYITTHLPHGGKFVTSGGNAYMTIVSDSEIRNSDIPAIIKHLQQWYDAVQLEKGNNK